MMETFVYYAKLLVLLDEHTSSYDDYELELGLSDLMNYLGTNSRDTKARENIQRRLEKLSDIQIISDDGQWTSYSALLLMQWSETFGGDDTVTGSVRFRFSPSVVDSYRDWRDLRDALDVSIYRSLRNPASQKLLRFLHSNSDQPGTCLINLDSLHNVLSLSPQLSSARAREMYKSSSIELTSIGFLKRDSSEY